MIRGFMLSGLAVCLCATFAAGQTAVAVPATSSAGGGTFTTSTVQYNTPAITGAPYSAEQVQERVQTLADGTHITQNYAVQRTWRDSQGRTRTERTMGSPIGPNAFQPPVIIEIRDPAASSVYILDTQAKVAHRIALQPMPGRMSTGVGWSLAGVMGTNGATTTASAPRTAPVATGTAITAPLATPRPISDANRPQSSHESLGTQVIEGVLAQGTRMITVYPVGYQGNDRPITVTSESWYSPDLRATVLTKTSDPRSGDSTMKLTHVSLADPDPLLFMPPADYSIVEETGAQVTIHYTLPAR